MGDENTEHIWIQYPVQDALAVSDQPAQVCRKVHTNHVLQDATFRAYTDKLADNAGGPITSDQVIACYVRSLRTALEGADHLAVSLAHSHALMAGKKVD